MSFFRFFLLLWFTLFVMAGVMAFRLPHTGH